MVHVIPVKYAGLDTMTPPVVSFVLFVIVTLLTHRKYHRRHSVVDYVSPQQDVIRGVMKVI
jgi:solute:Na+ symporter, SSS family